MGNKKSAVLSGTLSFLIPASLLLLAFASMGMAPFGDRSVLIMDLSDQYVEFFCGLKSGDILFSWPKALGGNYIGVFTYYLSSPLSFLTLLCPNSSMPVALLFLTVLKIGLAGLSFSLFLRFRFGKAGWPVVLFSAFYGLMSYNIAYSMCIMWLDGVIWLPVLILGVERIVGGKGFAVFAAALFASLISSYYITYMTGIFSFLYLLYRCFEEGLSGRTLCACLRGLIGAALLAAALAAFLLLPSLMSLIEGKLGGQNADYGGIFNFTIPAFLQKLLPGSYDSLTNSGAPFLYCGALAFVFFLAFFFQKAFDRRSKAAAALLTAVLFVSLWISGLDRIWHLFQYPNWFPYRYSFVLSFFILLTAYRVFHRLALPRAAAGLLAALSLLDMYGNTTGILSGLDAQFGYESYASYHDYKETRTPLIEAAKADQDGFFRVGATSERSKNEAIAFGYNGVTHYSSAYNRSLNALLSRLGFAQSYFWSSYFGATMVTDALFSVRYVLSERAVSPYYDTAAENGGTALYLNPYALSIGYAVPADAQAAFAYDSNPLRTQNRLVRTLTGMDADVFLPLACATIREAGTASYAFVSDGSPVYAWFSGGGRGARLLVNGTFISDLFSNETDCVQYIGAFPSGTEVSVTVEAEGDPVGVFYSLDMPRFTSVISQLRASELRVADYGSGYLDASVTAAENGLVVLTISYDAGWTVYVDGAETAPVEFADALLAIPVTEGGHRVELVYSPPGLYAGIGISIAALAGILFVLFKRRAKVK